MMAADLVRILRFVLVHPVNRGRPLRALRRFATWQAASRLAPGAIACEWVGGRRLLARRGDRGVTGCLYCGLADFEEMGFLLHVLRGGDRFADVGANAGVWTVLAAGVDGVVGWAFEPDPATFRKLRDNVRLNGAENRIRVLQAAVGEARGTVRFSSGLDSVNHVLGAGETGSAVEVPLVTLDEAFGGDAPTVMKIDVEGFETAVLRGALRTLADPRLQAVVVELIGCGARYGFDEREIPGRLAAHGFRACGYHPFDRRLTARSDGVRPGNGLFVRDIDWARARVAGAPPVDVFGLRV